MKTNIQFWSYLSKFFIESKMFHTKGAEKIETHTSCSVTYFKNWAIYEMCKNIVQLERPQMTIWCRGFACWIPKATNTHSKYVILIVFTLQQWLHVCASVLCYINIANTTQNLYSSANSCDNYKTLENESTDFRHGGLWKWNKEDSKLNLMVIFMCVHAHMHAHVHMLHTHTHSTISVSVALAKSVSTIYELNTVCISTHKYQGR